MAEKKNKGQRTLASNRRARREYEILERFEAGVALLGTEVKAARQGRVQLKDSYVEVRNGEAWLMSAHIGPYSHGNLQNHEAERPRKLLLNRREIDRLFGRTTIRGQTCVPGRRKTSCSIAKPARRATRASLPFSPIVYETPYLPESAALRSGRASSACFEHACGALGRKSASSGSYGVSLRRSVRRSG